MTISAARHIGIGIERPAEEVYAFLSEPQNFPRWAAGLGRDFSHVEGMTWSVLTPMGRMHILFSEPNAYGILDHALLPEGAPAMHNPMRVMPNGSGCEVVFTLFRRDMSEDEMARDAAMVTQDLRELKALLEG